LILSIGTVHNLEGMTITFAVVGWEKVCDRKFDKKSGSLPCPSLPEIKGSPGAGIAGGSSMTVCSQKVVHQEQILVLDLPISQTSVSNERIGDWLHAKGPNVRVCFISASGASTSDF
jgi:hypothetical protein